MYIIIKILILYYDTVIETILKIEEKEEWYETILCTLIISFYIFIINGGFVQNSR